MSNMSVRAKLTLLFAVLGLVPAMILFAIFVYQEANFKNSYGGMYEGMAASIGETIDRNLYERYGDVQAFGFNTAAYDENNWHKPGEGNPLVVAMNDYAKAYGFYQLMVFVDTNGKVLAVNSRSPTGDAIDTQSVYGMDFSDTAWFRDAITGHFLNGTNGFTGTAVQQPAKSDLVSAIYKNPDYFGMIFSAPVKNTQGKTIGVWANFADFNIVENIIGDSFRHLRAQGMKSIDIMLQNKDGTILVDYDPEQVNEHGVLKRDFKDIGIKNLESMGLKAAGEATAGKRGFAIDVNPDSGEDALITYAPADGAYDYPGLGWSVIMGTPPHEAFAVMYGVHSLMLIALVVIATLSIIIGFLIGSAAARPLRRATAVMLQLAKGDLAVDIPDDDSKDELGDINRALVVFKDNGLKMESMKTEAAERERKSTEQKRQDMDRLANDFEQSVGQIVSAVASSSLQLQSNAKNLSEMAEQTNRQSASVAAATEEASASVQTVASAAEELSASIGEINRQVTESNTIVLKAVDEVKHTDTTVSTLSEAAGQIGDVVKLIQDIAEQTNLLALNATIEAARAGEAGKGFAVVASEVKNLANQTGRATEDIGRKIVTIQNVSAEAVAAIRSIGGTIEKINAITGAIADAIKEQTAATHEISNNVQQASAGTSEVSSSIINVTHAASESQSAAGEVLTASSELSRQSDRLREQIAAFVVKVRQR